MTSSGENELLATLQKLLDEPGKLTDEAVNRMILSVLMNLDRRVLRIEKLIPAVNVILWVGSAIGVSFIGLIWSIITGQASIIFN